MVLGAELISDADVFDFRQNSVECHGTSNSFRGGMEEKSGKLKLHLTKNQTQQSQQIILKLYAAVPFPFFVVFPDKFVCPNHCGLIQLKNFNTEVCGERDFIITIKDTMEGGRHLRFSAISGEERDSWCNSFQHVAQTCSREGNFKLAKRNANNKLPSLEEVSEEIEDQEERTVLKDCGNFLKGSSKETRPLTPRRRVVEAPLLEQISEEEEEEEDRYDSEMNFENRISSNSISRSSLKDCLSELSSTRGRTL